jgi:hypothetical protein
MSILWLPGIFATVTSSWEFPPGHTLEGVAVAVIPVGACFTVTVLVAMDEHPLASVPVTVYVVVVVGDAFTAAPVVGDSPVVGE